MESVSTLMDGELNVDDAGKEIARLKADSALRQNWDTYHLIGDVMRGSAAGKQGQGFSARLAERLALEPAVLAPQASRRTPRLTRKFQTYALSAAASVAAVAVVGWVTLTTVIPNTAITANTPATLTQGIAPQPAPQLAAAPGAATQQAAALPAPVPKPAVQTAAAPAEPMQEYLLAHQGISPTTAFQGVTPYIRTVSSSDE